MFEMYNILLEKPDSMFKRQKPYLVLLYSALRFDAGHIDITEEMDKQ